MTSPHRWFSELLDVRLAQPDQRSCGAAVLVLAEAWWNDAYARRLLVGGEARFGEEVLAMHRRVTGAVDVAGRLQLPWPRAVGTPPWAVARQLGGRTGLRYAVRPVWPWRRVAVLARIRAGVRAGHPVPLYVGTRRLPRHVVLVVDAGPAPDDPLTVHDPAAGRPRRLRAADFRAAGTEVVGWPVPWLAVLPDRVSAGRRPR